MDDTLAHLTAVPTINDQIPAADRRFPADPDTAFAHLAFELGHRQVNTIDHKIVRMDAGSAELLDYQIRAFEESSDARPAPTTPSSSTPTLTNPAPFSLLTSNAEQQACWKPPASGRPGSTPVSTPTVSYPDRTADSNTDADRRDWDDAIQQYQRTHPNATVDHDAELGKLRTMLAITTVQMAAQDANVGASLARRLDADELDTETDLVADFLHWSSAVLTDRLDDTDAVQAAAEVALAWSGADLAKRVRHADPQDLDLPVLLAVATVARPRP